MQPGLKAGQLSLPPAGSLGERLLLKSGAPRTLCSSFPHGTGKMSYLLTSLAVELACPLDESRWTTLSPSFLLVPIEVIFQSLFRLKEERKIDWSRLVGEEWKPISNLFKASSTFLLLMVRVPAMPLCQESCLLSYGLAPSFMCIQSISTASFNRFLKAQSAFTWSHWKLDSRSSSHFVPLLSLLPLQAF